MIVNCKAVGLDWTTCSMSAYFEALDAHNDASVPTAKQPADAGERLARFMKAHRALN